MFYFDNAATTKVCPEAVIKAMSLMADNYANPSSLHAFGKAAAAELAIARHHVAAAIGSPDPGIIFTSCGSESNTQAILSTTSAIRRIGKHVIASAVEHPSVLETLKAMESAGRIEVTYIKPGADGAIRVSDVEAALREDTALVTVMLVNNETGAVNPISKIRAVLDAHKSRAILHTDAVQGLFKVPIDVKTLGADMISLSGHKIHAPKGVGALYIRSGMTVVPLIKGGGQEHGLRSGTENMASVAAFGEAARVGLERFTENAAKIVENRRYFEEKLVSAPFDAEINYHGVPHIASVCLPGCRSEVTLRILSDRGVFVSAGSACAKGKRSHVLSACGLAPEKIDCTVRVSMSDMTEKYEIDALIDALGEAYARFHRK